MNRDMIRPVTGRQLALLAGKREQYISYARYAKIGLIALIVTGVAVFWLLISINKEGYSFTTWYRVITWMDGLAGIFYFALLGAFISLLWSTYKAEQLEFINEDTLEPQHYGLLEDPNYRELKKLQGGVYNFQFQKLKAREFVL